jgi:tRNA (guanine37-N1)-methyltransferase
MRFNVVTIFPEQLTLALNYGVIGKAMEDSKLFVKYYDPRSHADNKYGSIDDKPYGGGPGMVMQAQPILQSIDDARGSNKEIPVIFLTPQGRTYNQEMAHELSRLDEIIIVSSRYEGLDQRAINQTENHQEISIGDYILSGGETACSVVIDSVARLLPGVLGDDESVIEESFSDGLLEYPHYTRPTEVNREEVPEVLLSGNHQKIIKWRRDQSIKKTYLNRPDLINKSKLSDEENKLLDDLENERE